ncbi:MAG: RIP metalloprotease RseP [Desulfobacterales bacterium]|nr:RIP metalloprotease RseP [Desulfobacterales bacterium]MCP4161534.1 RIP metalloprotease RseP [Deltaproteobacteria bacterium]
MDFLITSLSFIVVIGILVTFHELGHFLVARFFNVGVEKFSVGFGKPIFSKKIGYTEYILASIPLGGYVKMTGEQYGEEVDPELEHISFSNKTVFQRAMIVAAGPIFNFLLAVLVYFLIFLFSGVPKSVIGEIPEGTPAYKAGLMRGDVVLSINGEDALSWGKMDSIIEDSNGKVLEFEISRKGITFQKFITPIETSFTNIFNEKQKSYSIGVGRVYEPLIGDVAKDHPAMKSGIKAGDLIVSIDGKSVFTSSDVSKYVIKNGDKELAFEIERNGERQVYKITPAKVKVKDKSGKDVYVSRVGIAFESNPPLTKLSLLDACTESVSNSVFIVKSTVIGIYKMINGSVSSDNIGGPILIAQIAGKVVKKGLKYYLNFIAVLSINLAILNLIPIPVLDGGHLMFYTVEAITRKPVNRKVRETAQNIGVLLLFLLIFYSVYNDIVRLIK